MTQRRSVMRISIKSQRALSALITSILGGLPPLIRNKEIVERADMVIAVWDGISRGTKSAVQYAQKIGKPVKVFRWERAEK